MGEQIIKYTKDGKKVAVLGKLNSEEPIVQEVFVSRGQEIPAGENFVAKGLLDAPAESWKEKNLRELEERYDRERKRLEDLISKQDRELGNLYKKAKLKASAIFGFLAKEDQSIQTLIDFLSGGITHAFCDRYSPEIVKIDDNIFFDLHNRGRPEAMKLISLVGGSNGNLEYRVHDYSDGSGGFTTSVKFARSYDEALAFAQQECDAQARAWLDGDKGYFSAESWLKIEGIEILPEAMAKFEARREESRQKQIADLKEKLEALYEANQATTKPN